MTETILEKYNELKAIASDIVSKSWAETIVNSAYLDGATFGRVIKDLQSEFATRQMRGMYNLRFSKSLLLEATEGAIAEFEQFDRLREKWSELIRMAGSGGEVSRQLQELQPRYA